MNKQQLENCMEFLKRVDLKGGEAPAFMDVLAGLDRLHEEVKNSEQRPDSSTD